MSRRGVAAAVAVIAPLALVAAAAAERGAARVEPFPDPPDASAVTRVRAAALDGDAAPELVTFGVGGVVTVLDRDDGGRGWRRLDVTGAGSAVSPVADFDGDGRPEILIRSAGAWTPWRTDGRRITAGAPVAAEGATPPGAVASDLDGDGLPEIVEAAREGSRLWWNHSRAGRIEFLPGVALPPAAAVAVLAAGTGVAPPVVALGGPDGGIEAYAPAGDRLQPLRVEAHVGRVADFDAADIDNDGLQDLLAVDAGGRWQVLVNRGGTALEPVPGGAGEAPAARLADFDNDGWIDVVVAPAGGGLALTRGGPGPRFAPAGAIEDAGGIVIQTLEIADLDGDGRLDVLAVDASGVVRAYRNVSVGHRWIGLRLHAPGGGAALGTAAVAVRKDGSRIVRYAGATGSVVIGLGLLPQVDLVAAYWPNGRVTRWQPEGLDRYADLSAPAGPPPAGRRAVGEPQRFYIDGRYECR